MKYIGKLEMTGCTFEYNMADLGPVYIEYWREFWEVDTSADGPYDLLNTHDEVITIDS